MYETTPPRPERVFMAWYLGKHMTRPCGVVLS